MVALLILLVERLLRVLDLVLGNSGPLHYVARMLAYLAPHYLGIALPFAEHIAHHKPPFDKHYCILTGGLNAVLDSEPVLFWRRLEALVYACNGQEPLSWKDDRVKQLALSTWPGQPLK